MHGKNQDAGRQLKLGNFLRSFESAQVRHRDIHDDDVGMQFLCQAYCFAAINGLSAKSPSQDEPAGSHGLLDAQLRGRPRLGFWLPFGVPPTRPTRMSGESYKYPPFTLQIIYSQLIFTSECSTKLSGFASGKFRSHEELLHPMLSSRSARFGGSADDNSTPLQRHFWIWAKLFVQKRRRRA